MQYILCRLQKCFIDMEKIDFNLVCVETSIWSSSLVFKATVKLQALDYSILESFDQSQRSQSISIKFPLHKESESPWTYY
jgi:hypothetical protein